MLQPSTTLLNKQTEINEPKSQRRTSLQLNFQIHKKQLIIAMFQHLCYRAYIHFTATQKQTSHSGN